MSNNAALSMFVCTSLCMCMLLDSGERTVLRYVDIENRWSSYAEQVGI